MNLPPLGLVATLMGRFQLHRAARQFAGVWEAREMAGRDAGPEMNHAFLTTISARPLWTAEPGVLDYHAQDWDDSNKAVREHYGFIEINPRIPTQGTRTVIYKQCGEIVHQRIEFGDNPNILYVSPIESGYNKHALRRTNRRLDR